jgi:hypothetical protein
MKLRMFAGNKSGAAPQIRAQTNSKLHRLKIVIIDVEK